MLLSSLVDWKNPAAPISLKIHKAIRGTPVSARVNVCEMKLRPHEADGAWMRAQQ